VRLIVLCAYVLGLCLVVSAARAADPQPYTVTLDTTGASDIDDVLQNSSLLVTLRDVAPVPPFGLVTRATGDIERLKTAINSFGYYQPMIAITIAGRDVNDPAVSQILDETPAGTAVAVHIAIVTGSLYRLGRITVDGAVPASAEAEIKLTQGEAAVAANVVAAQGRLLTSLQEQGYAFADVHQPIAYADDEAHTLDIVFEAVAGPKVDIGDIRFEGLKGVSQEFAQRAFTVKSGELYQPSAIERARQALLQTGIFNGATIRPGEMPNNGRVDLVIQVEERPAHAVSVAGTYSTDLGVSLSGTWSHRNLFGNAEQLNLTAAGTGLWGNATDDVGYQLSAQFIKPMFLRDDQTLETSISAVKQDLRAYTQRAETLTGLLRRKFSRQWTGTASVSLAHDVVSQKSVDRKYQLLSTPVAAIYDSTGLTNPSSVVPAKAARSRRLPTETDAAPVTGAALGTAIDAIARTVFHSACFRLTRKAFPSGCVTSPFTMTGALSKFPVTAKLAD
jgi:translocation and assembly module TamA